ncbi:MAG TPA: sortase [Candidatus Limnocylindrales bacterium]|nr:sortase [Candidatus Limnocylindrales bacterium]
MRDLLDILRARLLPAILTATGVALVAAGLLTYTVPVEAQPSDTPAPTDTVVVTPAPSTPSGSPGASPAATATPTPGKRVATRVQVPALAIDLPVIKPPGGSGAYPLCNVAMYLQELGQPGGKRATYIYAHARTGMFLPLLEGSKINNGARLKGMIVKVYTSDDQLFLYEIREVRRHALQADLDDAVTATTEQLWLQTSEGPRGAPGVVTPKLMIVAFPLSSQPANHADAHPRAKPLVCG